MSISLQIILNKQISAFIYYLFDMYMEKQSGRNLVSIQQSLFHEC